jgi:hypothetical protein
MSKVSKAVAVPLTAVFIDAKRTVAYVKKGERFEKRDVEAGISDSAVVEIKKGVSAGDEVATEKPADEKLMPTTAPAPTTAPTTGPATATTVGLVPSPMYSWERVRVRVISSTSGQPKFKITLTPALSHEYVGEGEKTTREIYSRCVLYASGKTHARKFGACSVAR